MIEKANLQRGGEEWVVQFFIFVAKLENETVIAFTKKSANPLSWKLTTLVLQGKTATGLLTIEGEQKILPSRVFSDITGGVSLEPASFNFVKMEVVITRKDE